MYNHFLQLFKGSVFPACILAAILLCGAPFSAAFAKEAYSAADFELEELTLHIPGIREEKTLLWISDLHLVKENDGTVSEDCRDQLNERFQMFKDADGRPSSELWKKLPEWLNGFQADGIILGADMLDYVSKENIEQLKEGLDRLSAPWIYIRADHDYGRWYTDMDLKTMRRLHKTISERDDIYTLEYEDFLVVGMNLTTSQISEEALSRFREICSEGKSVILAVHVPLDEDPSVKSSGQEGNLSLAEASKMGWDGRALIWGKDCEYLPNENTQQFLDIVCKKDGPVKAVLAGHLHLSWDGMISESCTEHVFDAAFKGKAGLIHVTE